MRTNSGEDFAARHWYRLSVVSLLLIPFSLVFALLSSARRFLYRAGLFRSVRLQVSVIVVGNLTVGGSGKTPLVLWIEALLRNAGFHPGIVLRGYGGSSATPQAVSAGSDPLHVGDEAVLLAARARSPVWAGRNRAATAQSLLQANPGCDIVLCDDGLQHYGLARDFEIAVEDDRGHGNGLLLPAGPLREPSRRRVDVTIVNLRPGIENKSLPVRGGPVMQMTLLPDGLRRVGGSQDGADIDIATLSGKRLHAIAGIGNPRRFFAALNAMGLQAQPHVFADHHPYTETDLDFPECDAIVMTEKDAVKCRSFARDDMVVLRVDAQPEPALAELILKACQHGFPSA